MEFDIPGAGVIKNLPKCNGFAGLPFIAYYKNGKVVKASTSIQSREQITGVLDKYLS